jgi:hypothetical protein
MENVTRIIIFVIFVIVFYLAYSKGIDAIRKLRIKKGLDKKGVIIIKDDETEFFDEVGQQIFREPNLVIYQGNKLLLIGSSEHIQTIEDRNNIRKLNRKNFVKELDDVLHDLKDFWYHYMTYLVLKFEKLTGISSFVIPSVSVRIDVSSKAIRDKIQMELEKAKTIKRPRVYNILDVT